MGTASLQPHGKASWTYQSRKTSYTTQGESLVKGTRVMVWKYRKEEHYIEWRWVKFPILGDRVPDKPMLAISLQEIRRSTQMTKWVGIALNTPPPQKKAPQKKGKKRLLLAQRRPTQKKRERERETENRPTYRDVTKPSAEQPTIFQVQGSTELISHPSSTW